MSLEARPVENEIAFPNGSAVMRVEYELGQLSVFVRGSPNESSIVVDFSEVIGFRVLDERDLMEFWPACSAPNGGLFEIYQGGWLAQELARPGSLIGPMNMKALEYLVTGVDDCVSVLTQSPPLVRKFEV